MTIDIAELSARLSRDERFTDYEYWRAIRDLEARIYALGADSQPIPIELLRMRAILRRAQALATQRR